LAGIIAARSRTSGTPGHGGIPGAEQGWRRVWHPYWHGSETTTDQNMSSECRKFNHSHAKRAIALVKSAKKQRWHVRCSGFN